jgi:mediator of RNA polymerase II transcription subunit 12
MRSTGSSKDLHSIATLDSTSRFSAWRWTSVILSTRVEFKRLSMRISCGGDDGILAKRDLNELVRATLGRKSTADDTDLLCEAFRGMESVISREVRR